MHWAEQYECSQRLDIKITPDENSSTGPSQSKRLGWNCFLIVYSLCSYVLCTSHSSCEWMHYRLGFTFRSPDKKSFLTVTGEWNGQMYAKYADKEVNLLFSTVVICWISFCFQLSCLSWRSTIYVNLNWSVYHHAVEILVSTKLMYFLLINWSTWSWSSVHGRLDQLMIQFPFLQGTWGFYRYSNNANRDENSKKDFQTRRKRVKKVILQSKIVFWGRQEYLHKPWSRFWLFNTLKVVFCSANWRL